MSRREQLGSILAERRHTVERRRNRVAYPLRFLQKVAALHRWPGRNRTQKTTSKRNDCAAKLVSISSAADAHTRSPRPPRTHPHRHNPAFLSAAARRRRWLARRAHVSASLTARADT